MIDFEGMVNGVRDGHVDPLKAYIELKAFEKRFKDILSEVQDKAIDEARKYDQKCFKAFGAEITLRANAGTWNYKTSEAWVNKKNSLKEFEELMQAAFKAKQKGNTIVDENGEVIDPAIYVPGADNISVKILPNL